MSHDGPDVAEIQAALGAAGLDGWLFYDFRGSDPIARKTLGLDPENVGSRRWFYLIPASGEPRGLVHRIESTALDSLPGKKTVYLSWQSLEEGLRQLLSGASTVAMQYSPGNHIPTLSRVDAGTVELLRSFGLEIVSSGDLVQRFEATLAPEQITGHRRTADRLHEIVREVFERVAVEIPRGLPLTEKDLQDHAMRRFEELGLTTYHPPIVGVNEHAADPHFEVPERGSARLREGDLLLFDLWAKEDRPGAIYADITWCAFIGAEPPPEMVRVFEVVRNARDAAVALCDEAFRKGRPLRGHEVDRATRDVIVAGGHGEHFIHRTGHSIHEETHGNGANMDDLETHDTRELLPQTLFSIEPGIYLPGRFGIRSEINVLHAGDRAEVTGPGAQTELRGLLPAGD